MFTLSPIIMEVGNGCIYYWGYTHFSLNHDYGRKGIFSLFTNVGTVGVYGLGGKKIVTIFFSTQVPY